jgi:hypothetical protein
VNEYIDVVWNHPTVVELRDNRVVRTFVQALLGVVILAGPVGLFSVAVWKAAVTAATLAVLSYAHKRLDPPVVVG